MNTEGKWGPIKTYTFPALGGREGGRKGGREEEREGGREGGREG